MSQYQPFDTTIKSIFKEDAAEILPQLLPGITVVEVLDIEVLRPPMRVDRVYRVLYKGKPHILEVEVQAGADDDIAYRTLIYHANLLNDYRLPVITLIIYLFQATLPESPLRETSDDEELLTFHFKVLPLWNLDAREYVEKHAISMYALLPTMQHANAEILLQAIDDMVEYYKDDESKLGRQLLWLSILLHRAEIVPMQDKHIIEERIDTFEQLLEEDEFVRKQRTLGERVGFSRGKEEGFSKGKEEGFSRGTEEGFSRGKEKGIIEGEIHAAQRILIEIVSRRYPDLRDMAQQKAARTKNVDVLYEVIGLLSVAPSEEMVRFILTSPPVA